MQRVLQKMAKNGKKCPLSLKEGDAILLFHHFLLKICLQQQIYILLRSLRTSLKFSDHEEYDGNRNKLFDK